MKTKETIEILKKAGWELGRERKIKKEIDFLEIKGYSISDSFVSFYKEYGELYIDIKVKGNDRVIDFNIYTAVSYDYDEVIINDYPKIIGSQSLIPIGNIDATSYLVIDENKKIYSLYDGSVLVIGEDPDNALNNLFSKGWREFEELAIPDWW